MADTPEEFIENLEIEIERVDLVLDARIAAFALRRERYLQELARLLAHSQRLKKQLRETRGKKNG
jgi:hypothetical protein